MPRKLTQAEFEEKLRKQNKHAQDIELLEAYKNRNTKILCRCKICEHEWTPVAGSLLQGHGCPKCGGTGKLTNEEFIEKFNKQNKHSHHIEILGTYINSATKILCRCKIDRYEWETIPSSLLQGKGCPKCGCSVKSTHEEFMEKFNKQNKHANDIELLEPYKNRKTKILCKCKIDEYKWTPTADQLLHGQGCPKCGGTKKLTHEEFIEKLKQVNPNIQVLGTYINSATKILCRCTIDEYEWTPTPRDLLQGYGCPKCGNSLKSTHEEFIQKLQQVNPDIEILEPYKNNKTKIKCKCKVCEHEWQTIPSSLLQGRGCPKCNTSKGEKRVAQYLDNLGINYIYNKKYFNDLVGTGGGLLRPDFIIPSLKIWIEYDGIQHYEPRDFSGGMSEQQLQEQFKLVQQNDQIKDQYAKDNNWTLIRIPYTEYDNIEQILAGYLN